MRRREFITLLGGTGGVAARGARDGLIECGQRSQSFRAESGLTVRSLTAA
jgi:hypothetical protein